MRVHILGARTHWSRRVPGYWAMAAAARRALAERGLRLRFLRELDEPGATDCDVLILKSNRLRPYNTIGETQAERDGLLELLDGLRRRVPALIWLDWANSSGTTQFEVLDHVSLYVKTSLLRDRSLYRQPFWGGRIYADFYRREFGVDENSPRILSDKVETEYTRYPADGIRPAQTSPAPLPEGGEAKLAVAWSLAYHDFRRGTARDRVLNRAADWAETWLGLPHRLYYRSPDAPRPLHLVASFRIYDRPIHAAQRRRAVDLLEDLGDPGILCRDRRMDYHQYLRAMGSSQMVLSCFGLGEICFREHEAWAAGAAVLMPDMSHLETFPDLYRPGETYQPLRWDLADLVDTYQALRADDRRRLELARGGHEAFRRAWSNAGKVDFAAHFEALCRRALTS